MIAPPTNRTDCLGLLCALVAPFWLMGCAAPQAALPGAAPTPVHVVDGHMRYADEVPAIVPRDRDAPFMEQVDWAHDALFAHVQRTVGRWDQHFASDTNTPIRTPVSRLRLSTDLEVADRDSIDVSVDLDVDIELDMPNLEERASIFITSEAFGQLAGLDAGEGEDGFLIGLRRHLPAGLDADAGVKARLPPEPFVRLRWTRGYDVSRWRVYPGVEGFWRLEEGFGTTADFTADRSLDRYFFRSASGIRISEKTLDFEWSQTLFLGYAWELIDEENQVRRADTRDLARGAGLRYRVIGDTASGRVQEHELVLYLKFPVRRQWAYLVVAPGVGARNAGEWELEPSLLLGMDALFWGLGDR